jgi:hypothetical protein
LTKARDLANASTALSAVSATELAFVDGVTSAIQTQLDARATLTGTQTLTNKTLTSPVLTTPTISTVNAKGDLLAGTADNTVDRLAVGNDGEQIVADSSTSTGLRYQSGYNGNGIINGGMDIWQRGTSIANTATYAYAQDRYRMGASTAQTTTRQAVNDTTNLPTIQYCARVQRNSGSTSTTDLAIAYSAESADSYRFAGQTVTLSFYARAGANYSAASSAFRAVVQTGTGTDQNILSGYTGSATIINGVATLTTTWQRFTFTATVAATATEIGHSLYYTPVGTAGANDYAEVTGVQLELGSVATTFKRSNGAGGTIQGELAACQRYYYNFANGTDKPIGVGFYNTATNAQCVFKLPVTMRTNPTLVATTGSGYYQLTAGGVDDTFNSLTIFNVSTESVQLYNNTEASGTIGYAGMMKTVNASASAAFSAEL